MRFVIYGAGAIGALVGARLFEHGHETVLIARGPHRRAIEEHGLTVGSQSGTQVLRVPVVGHPAELSFSQETIVILGMKAQDTLDALRSLADVAPSNMPIVALQNGVENERAALRLFENVYGGYVMVPAAHLEPGSVLAFSAPKAGALDVGRYPEGVDDLAASLASAFRQCEFDSLARPDIMRWKYAKLVSNLANAADAVCGPGTRWTSLGEMVRQEGSACLRAADISFVPEAEESARWQKCVEVRPVGDREYPGGSTSQSLTRGTGAVETDYLNGEIVLLGRMHGIATPVNSLLVRLANEMARKRLPPGSIPAADVMAQLES